MSNDLEFRCPVCRAAQTLRQECRRCRADLTLVERAHRRIAWLMMQQQKARADEDFSSEQVLTAELRQLAPARLAAVNWRDLKCDTAGHESKPAIDHLNPARCDPL